MQVGGREKSGGAGQALAEGWANAGQQWPDAAAAVLLLFE